MPRLQITLEAEWESNDDLHVLRLADGIQTAIIEQEGFTVVSIIWRGRYRDLVVSITDVAKLKKLCERALVFASRGEGWPGELRDAIIRKEEVA